MGDFRVRKNHNVKLTIASPDVTISVTDEHGVALRFKKKLGILPATKVGNYDVVIYENSAAVTTATVSPKSANDVMLPPVFSRSGREIRFSYAVES